MTHAAVSRRPPNPSSTNDCSPYRGLHVRRERVGVVHRSRAISLSTRVNGVWRTGGAQFPFMDPKVHEPLRCCGNVYSFYQSNKQKLGVGCHLFEGAGCHGGNGGGRYGTEWHRRMTTFKGGQVRANMLGALPPSYDS
jgi:hypothetical protein